MNIDSDVLLARSRRDFPHEYEVCQLRCLVDALTRENDDLHAQLEQPRPDEPLRDVRGIGQPGTSSPFVGSYPLASDTEVPR